jgi:hypothetical protein
MNSPFEGYKSFGIVGPIIAEEEAAWLKRLASSAGQRLADDTLAMLMASIEPVVTSAEPPGLPVPRVLSKWYLDVAAKLAALETK